MTTLRDLQTTVTGHSAEIADLFNRSTAREPWIQLPEPDRLNYLRNMISPLAKTALDDRADPAECRHVLHVAARHGQHRHDLGLPEQILFDDIYYFRWAICAQIDPEENDNLYAEAITRIDGVLSLAAFASLRGYYRDAFEARGQWPETIDEIGARWGYGLARELRHEIGARLEGSETRDNDPGSGEFFLRYRP